MSFSINYNGTDLSTYGLTLKSEMDALAVALDYNSVQLPDRSYVSRPQLPPKSLNFEVVVKATTSVLLQTYLDAIRRICAQLTDKPLILDVISDRFWEARFTGMSGQRIAPSVWEGTLSFVADDPLSYSTTQTSSDFSIDADPKTITESVGGTFRAKPLYTLTAGEALNDITLLVKNVTLDEELSWEGSLSNGERLTIDVPYWIVKVEGTADMADVSGEFPGLVAGQTNYITITGFGSAGSLNIQYRDTYL
jgi:predicted phage tail component-like protein